MFALLSEVNEYRNETIKSFGRRLYQENIECLHNEKFRSEQKITNKMNIPYEYEKSQGNSYLGYWALLDKHKFLLGWLVLERCNQMSLSPVVQHQKAKTLVHRR